MATIPLLKMKTNACWEMLKICRENAGNGTPKTQKNQEEILT